MIKQSSAVEQLVMALLAVGGFSLERVWAIFPALREQGLLDPDKVQREDIGALTRALAVAGYDRGPTVTPMMAERLRNVHVAISNGVLKEALSELDKDRDGEASRLLCRIKGVGQRVFENFVALYRG